MNRFAADNGFDSQQNFEPGENYFSAEHNDENPQDYQNYSRHLALVRLHGIATR